MVMIDMGLNALLEKRIEATRAETIRNLNTTLYGDDRPAPVLTVWQRLSRYISVRRDRIADAWLVLTGRADIYG